MNWASGIASLKVLSRNRHLQATGILILLLVVVYRDVVFFGRTFLIETAAPGTMPLGGPYQYHGTPPGFVSNDPGAIAWQTEPTTSFISQSLKKGDFPLWNPYEGLAGGPILADGYTGPLEPIQFLFFLVPNRYWPSGVDLQLLIRFFIAGFFCYLFARRQNLGFAGSITAGALFMLSSYFMTFGNHPQIKTESLLPLVLYGYDRLADPDDRLAPWICALATGWALIAAMPEATFFALFLGTLWYFCKSMFGHAESRRIPARARDSVLRYLGPTGLGFLISAVFLFPFVEFISVGRTAHAALTAAPRYLLWELPRLLVPTATSRQLTLGFFALFCLVFCLLQLRNCPKYRTHIIFFGSYAAIFACTIFDFPLTNWIHLLPVFNQLSLSKYPIPSVVFCLAILAGICSDQAGSFFLSLDRIGWAFLIVVGVILGLPIVANLRSVTLVFLKRDVFLYPACALIAAIFIVLFALAFLYKRQKISLRTLQIGLLLLVILEPLYWSTNIDRPDRVDPFQAPPFVDYLRKDDGFFRIFGLTGALYPNVATPYRLADIRWLNAVIPQRTFAFTTQFINSEEPPSMRFTGTVYPISDTMFNLLGVKYIVTKNSAACPITSDTQPYFENNSVDELILQQNSKAQGSLSEPFLTLNGDTRPALLAAAPQIIQVGLRVPAATTNLDFSIALDPKVFQPKFGDGVTFSLALSDGHQTYDLFSKYIDPKNNLCDRRWFDERVDLGKWSGQAVVLSFSTDPGPAQNNNSDLAYWGSIGFSTPTTRPPYELVERDNDTLIYQNTNVLPRAFVVHRVDNVTSRSASLSHLTRSSFDPGQTAVVENLPTELANSINSGSDSLRSEVATARLVNSGEVDISASTKTPGLLVLSDQYYPGWTAIVDGKEATIYAVDETLRGVYLDQGNHMIEFKYRPLSVVLGGLTSVVSLVLTLALLLYTSKSRTPQLNRNE